MNTTLTNLWTTAQTAATNYAASYNRKDPKSKQQELKKAAMAAMKAYNAELERETYRTWKSEGDPIRIAVRMRYVPQKAVKFATDEADYMVVEYQPKQARASLPEMQATLGAEIFSDPSWFAKSQKLAFLFAHWLNRRTAMNATFVYSIEEAARDFAFAEDVNPISGVGVIHALQKCIDAVCFVPDETDPERNKIAVPIYEENGEVFSPYWEVIRACMAVEGETCMSLTVGNMHKMSALILDAMHTVYTNGNIVLTASK